jgi:hypothetical protein
MTNTTNWYNGVFISLFAQLAAHYTHITYEEHNSTQSQRVNLLLLIHVTYPKETLVPGQYKAIPPGVTSVIAVLHEEDHYTVLEIDILNEKVYVYDGLYRDLDRWLDYVFSAMKCCMICGLEAAHQCHPDEPTYMTVGGLRQPKMSIEGYKLTLGSNEWRFKKGLFVKQADPFNCGPIACTKIMGMFQLILEYEVKIAYAVNGIRTLVTEHWK